MFKSNIYHKTRQSPLKAGDTGSSLLQKLMTRLWKILASRVFNALDLSGTCIRELTVCWNDSFSKIFSYKRCESVKLLQFCCSELQLEYICDLQRCKFLSAVPARLITLYQFKRHTLDSLSRKYGLNNSTAGIKRTVIDCFASAVFI